MPRKNADVLLITDDRRLCELVGRHRPPPAQLQCVSTQELTAQRPVRARQVWIDLDSAPGGMPTQAWAWHAPGGERRVYFHSRERPAPEELPPGLFIRRPCTSAVLEVLWAGVELKAGSAPGTVPSPTGRALPAWLLDFHELNLKALCRKCTTDLPQRLGYRDVSLYLHGFRHGLLTLAETTHGRPVDLTVRLDAVDQHLMAAVARKGRILRTDKVSAELRSYGIPRHADRPYPDEECLVAPLVSDGRLWGVLNFSGCVRTALTEVGLPLEEVFCFLGRALHHACAYEQAQTEARVDGLTGLYNQRWMMEALEKEIRRAQRFATTLSVLMIDLDGLKGINDREGHVAGDCLLRHVAGRIRAVLRQFDGAARVGGDEFVVMLPATGLKGAQRVARRLLRSIREDTAHFRDVPLPITASVGVAEWREGWHALQLVDAADRAMYRAKGQGRDQLVCHPHDRPPTLRLGRPASSESRPAKPMCLTAEPSSRTKPVPESSARTAPPPEPLKKPAQGAKSPGRRDDRARGNP